MALCLFGGDIPDGGMKTLTIIVSFDVGEQVVPGGIPGWLASQVHEFGFQSAEATFNRGGYPSNFPSGSWMHLQISDVHSYRSHDCFRVARIEPRTMARYIAFSEHEQNLAALRSWGRHCQVASAAERASRQGRAACECRGENHELLLRTLMAFKRGEPRVCAMVVVPTPEEEDRRRLSRERKTMVKERIEHINRIKGLMACQGIVGFEPRRAKARERLDELRTGDGRPIPGRMKAEIRRELERLELLRKQIAEIEAERDALLSPVEAAKRSPGAQLLKLRGIGPEFASVLWQEGLYRRFANQRELAAYAGLAPSPWRSGDLSKEQGISKSGNARLRTTMIEAAWLWLRHQPKSALSLWFKNRVKGDRGRHRRVAIVALARKLLIAFWRFATDGEIPEGAELKIA